MAGEGGFYVKKVDGAVKKGVCAQLGRKTLVVGPNASGKSSIINALELATSGRASDVAGRQTLARDADLFMLAAPGADRAWAEAKWSDGATSGWDLREGKRATRTGRSCAWPLREVTEALLGSPETARKWILSKGGGLDRESILALIPESLHGRIPGGSDLSAMLDTAKSRARDASKSAKVLRATPTPSQPPPTDRELAEMESTAGAPDVAVTVSIPRPSANTPDLTLFRAGLAVLESMVSGESQDCGICGSTLIRDPTYFQERAKRGRAKLAQLETPPPPPPLPAGPSPELLAARSCLSAARQLRAAWDAARTAEDRALAFEREAVEWSQLVEALGLALGRLVEKTRVAFEARVQAHLPASDRFGIDLLDGEREVLRVGLRRDGRLHAALSGAEWARVTAALALAVAPAGEPAIVCPEERAFDPDTLASVLDAFGACSAQVVVTSPVAPSRVPEGWTVIRR